MSPGFPGDIRHFKGRVRCFQALSVISNYLIFAFGKQYAGSLEPQKIVLQNRVLSQHKTSYFMFDTRGMKSQVMIGPSYLMPI